MRRLASRAPADDLKGYGGIVVIRTLAGENPREAVVLLQENIDLPADQLGWGIAEHMLACTIHPLDRSIEACRDDGVGCGIDDGMVPGVLPFAQDPLSGHRDGHVVDLQQAMNRPA